MTRILTITLCALMLAGCADGHDKAAGINDCKRPASADPPLSRVDLSDINNAGHNFDGVPGRNVPGGGREPLPHDTSACVHNQDNKGNDPQTQNLQKIGAALLSGIESRL